MTDCSCTRTKANSGRMSSPKKCKVTLPKNAILLLLVSAHMPFSVPFLFLSYALSSLSLDMTISMFFFLFLFYHFFGFGQGVSFLGPFLQSSIKPPHTMQVMQLTIDM
ncbi:MAG: hypothetical protein J3R72DRAFT_443965 [Linnemannia gamsii]|nr:MAG: hypothetical protein J3R72DRAFT_443965 [Linnemannia gamsii]